MSDDCDLITLPEARSALNIDEDDDEFDDELAMYITAISQRLDDLCGPIVQRPVTEEAHHATGKAIWFNLVPVAAIDSVTEASYGTTTTLEAETGEAAGDYVLRDGGTVYAYLVRRSGWSDRTWPAGTVTVSYVAGRFESTEDVSAKFKQAAAKMLAWLWRGDQGAGTATFGSADEGTSLWGLGFALPNVVKELLAHEALPPTVA